MEEEVTTPPRGGRPATEPQGFSTEGGGVRPLGLMVHHEGREPCTG